MCELCGERFRVKHQLGRHMNEQHRGAAVGSQWSGESSAHLSVHVCPDCSRGYAKLPDMLKHVRTEHGRSLTPEGKFDPRLSLTSEQ